MMPILPKQLNKRKKWMSILLWSFGIASGIFSLMWLRIGFLDQYLNDVADSMLFFTPHCLIAVWGGISGFFGRNNRSQIPVLQYPIYSLLLVAIFLGVIVLLWRAVADPMIEKSYTENIVTFLFSRSVVIIPLFWVVVPFSTGYILTKIIRCLNKRFSSIFECY